VVTGTRAFPNGAFTTIRIQLYLRSVHYLVGMNKHLKLAALALSGLAVTVPVVLGQTSTDEATRRIKVPEGFSISTFQDGLKGPRLMVFGPDSRMYLSLQSGGQIVRLADADKNGKADKVEVLKDGLRKPHGLAWLKSGADTWLYVAEENQVQRFKQASDGSLGAGQVIVADIPAGGRHTSRTLHFGPDGKLYVSVGSSTNKEGESDPRRAAILRFNTDGSIPSDNPYATNADARLKPVWASGLRNAVDFLWTPNGELWANSHGSDDVKLDPEDQPDKQPFEELVNQVEKGKNYGWPYCIAAKLGVNAPADKEIADPTTGASNPKAFDCATKSTPPLFTTLAHAAPIGMAWGTPAKDFPMDYQSSLYIAEHGSWNTNVPANYRDCQVNRVIVQNGQPVKSEPFAVVIRDQNEKCGNAWARPAGVGFSPDGRMFVSDDKGGRVFLVTYKK
jgi:glucose/arabinose dehydrogenase